jgi:hypothetical protein
VVAGAFVLLVLLPLVSPRITPPKYDEFIVTYDAQRLLECQVPYRDYFSFLPPGTYYLLAAVYAPFGKGSLTIARYASFAVIIASWLFLWGALKKSGWKARDALWVSLTFPVCWYPFWPVMSHHWTAYLCFVVFLWAVADGRWVADRRGLWAVGAIVGASIATLQTEAAYVAIGATALLTLSPKEGPPSGLMRAWCHLGLGAVAVLALAYGPLLLLGAGPNMVHDLLVWPARNYNQPGNDNARLVLEDLPVRLGRLWFEPIGLSAPMRMIVACSGTLMHVLLLLSAVVVLCATVLVLFGALRAKSWKSPFGAAACAITIAGCVLYLKGRPDWLHGLYHLAAIGSVWLVALAHVEGRVFLRRAIVIGAAVLVLSGGLHDLRRSLANPPGWTDLTDVDRRVREYKVNRFLRDPENVAPGETVVALPEGGEVYLYGPRPAIGFTLLFPLDAGLNDLEDHARAARDMERNRPRWVVLRPDTEKGFLDQRSPIGRILGKKYIRKGVLGAAVLYERRP